MGGGRYEGLQDATEGGEHYGGDLAGGVSWEHCLGAFREESRDGGSGAARQVEAGA